MIVETRNLSIVVVASSLFIAFILWLIPLPQVLMIYRPLWLLLVMSFWVMLQPERLSIGFAWMIGLLQDALSGGLLGEQALAMALCAYMVAKFQRRLLLVPLWYQTLFILVLAIIYLGFIFIVQGCIGQLPRQTTFWFPVVTTAALWPCVRAILGDWNLKFLK